MVLATGPVVFVPWEADDRNDIVPTASFLTAPWNPIPRLWKKNTTLLNYFSGPFTTQRGHWLSSDPSGTAAFYGTERACLEISVYFFTPCTSLTCGISCPKMR